MSPLNLRYFSVCKCIGSKYGGGERLDKTTGLSPPEFSLKPLLVSHALLNNLRSRWRHAANVEVMLKVISAACRVNTVRCSRGSVQRWCRSGRWRQRWRFLVANTICCTRSDRQHPVGCVDPCYHLVSSCE